MSEPKLTSEECSRLLRILSLDAKLEKLTDDELSQLAMKSVYGRMTVGSEEECVFLELLSRFERLAGIAEEVDDE